MPYESLYYELILASILKKQQRIFVDTIYQQIFDLYFSQG